nr:unnamed protein product [Callosobruchus chinensis]
MRLLTVIKMHTLFVMYASWMIILLLKTFFFCNSIDESGKAQDLFQILDKFITENNLDWEKCIGVCTDGARSMSDGRYGGLQALIRIKAPYAMWTHCIIHREALASKSLSSELNLVMERIIDVVNYIKTRPLKTRLFKILCMDMGAEHTALLYYSSARWLSRGNVLIVCKILYRRKCRKICMDSRSFPCTISTRIHFTRRRESY